MGLKEILHNHPDLEAVKADGFDEAAIGFEWGTDRLVYSIPACLDILREEMDIEDAYEYMEYNVLDAYVGEQTPIFIWD